MVQTKGGNQVWAYKQQLVMLSLNGGYLFKMFFSKKEVNKKLRRYMMGPHHTYKWTYNRFNPYERSYKWVTGVISPQSVEL